MLDCLAGVADRAIRDPSFQISATVANRARRDLYKVRTAAAIPQLVSTLSPLIFFLFQVAFVGAALDSLPSDNKLHLLQIPNQGLYQ